MDIAFKLNSKTGKVDAPETTTLLEVLRNHLGLMGTRYGCGLEQCGCCMVLVDGQPAYACTREVGTVAGKKVTTVEGLGTQAKPHPLQQAFLADQAGQCGYCPSGILISAKALLDKNPKPSRADIVAALDKHLCRCRSHILILRALKRAATPLANRRPASTPPHCAAPAGMQEPGRAVLVGGPAGHHSRRARLPALRRRAPPRPPASSARAARAPACRPRARAEPSSRPGSRKACCAPACGASRI